MSQAQFRALPFVGVSVHLLVALLAKFAFGAHHIDHRLDNANSRGRAEALLRGLIASRFGRKTVSVVLRLGSDAAFEPGIGSVGSCPVSMSVTDGVAATNVPFRELLDDPSQPLDVKRRATYLHHDSDFQPLADMLQRAVADRRIDIFRLLVWTIGDCIDASIKRKVQAHNQTVAPVPEVAGDSQVTISDHDAGTDNEYRRAQFICRYLRDQRETTSNEDCACQI